MPKNSTKYQGKWEDQVDPSGMFYKAWCKKQDNKRAWCKLCEKELKVDGMGKSAVTQHATTKKYRKRVPNCEQSIPNKSQCESNHHQHYYTFAY